MYTLTGVIGHGSYADVYSAVHQEDPLQCTIAVKIHKKSISSNSEAPENIIKETAAIAILDHANIIKQVSAPYIYEKYLHHPFLYVQKDLYSIIKEKEFQITSDVSQHLHFADAILDGTMRGMAYIHACGFIHRDIKMNNILIDPHSYHVFIADFGMCVFTGGRTMELATNMQTITYRAPEISIGAPTYDYSVDIWSIGMMYLELLMWEMNKHEPLKLFGYPENYTDKRIPGTLDINPCALVPVKLRSDEVCHKLMRMLQFYPRDRISAHTYIQRFTNDPNTRDIQDTRLRMLDRADLPLQRSFYMTSNGRCHIVYWICIFLTEYKYCDIQIACHITYATLRLFDYYTHLKHLDYSEMDRTEDNHNFIQKILSCCLGIQIKLREDWYSRVYHRIALYGSTHTTTELCEYEKVIMQEIQYVCFVTTPYDYFDLWELTGTGDSVDHAYSKAREICMQTIHDISRVTRTSRDIATECLQAAAKLCDTQPQPQPLIDELIHLYQNDPTINESRKLYHDADLQKIIDACIGLPH